MILPGMKKVRLYQEALARSGLRVGGDYTADLVPGLVATFAVVLVGLGCAIKAFDAANPRLSQAAHPVVLEGSEEGSMGGIWLSMSANGENIMVTTDDKQAFEWPLDPEEGLDSEGYEQFTDFLRDRRKKVVEDLVLSMDRRDIESGTRAVISVDERLTYAHFKPVMLAMANAGIRSYGFETRSKED